MKKIDPMAEKYYATSPYAYCGNDPVNAVDVEGKYITYRVSTNKSYIYYQGHFYENKRKFDDGHWKLMGKRIADPTNEKTPIYRSLNALRKLEQMKNPSCECFKY